MSSVERPIHRDRSHSLSEEDRYTRRYSYRRRSYSRDRETFRKENRERFSVQSILFKLIRLAEREFENFHNHLKDIDKI